MIKLFGFGANFGLPDPSPFVLKVATYLRMAGLDYEMISNPANLQKAPKGKLPFIDDDGEVVADSAFIFKYLAEKYNADLDAHLSEEQKAISYLVTKSLDENLYWCLLYSRWVRDEGWAIVSERFFGTMPLPLRLVVPNMLRKNIKKAFYKQGMGRHSEAEINEIAENSFRNLSALLGEKTYFFGDKPSVLDAAAYGLLSQFVLAQFNSPMNVAALEYKNLIDYCKRIETKFYS